MTLELTKEEAKTLMMYLKEEADSIRKLASQEVGQDKIDLINESKLIIEISERIQSNL